MKVSQEPPDPPDHQKESFSRASRGKILQILKTLKILRIIRRKDPQEDSQEQFRCTAVRVYVADFSPNLLKLDMYYQDYKNR